MELRTNVIAFDRVNVEQNLRSTEASESELRRAEWMEARWLKALSTEASVGAMESRRRATLATRGEVTAIFVQYSFGSGGAVRRAPSRRIKRPISCLTVSSSPCIEYQMGFVVGET